MLSFPNTAGPYKVGATTFSLPLRSPLVVGSAKLRHGKKALRPALVLEEVAFTAFYPAEISGSKQASKVDWLVRPISSTLRGYARFRNLSKIFTWLLWPFVYFFASLKIPVHSNAPLLSPASTSFHQWPLVIFSHGLGGSRTTYSQLCSRLAASGKVVLALEHRDGTGPAWTMRSPSGEMITKLYIKSDEVIWESDDKPSDPGIFPFRKEQLIFRHHEICLAYSAFSSLVKHGYNTEGSQLQTINRGNIEWESWYKRTPDDLPRVKCDNVSLVGHSFGGATMFSILSNPPPLDEYPLMNISHALVLDPWLEPLPSPGPAPYVIKNSIVNAELVTPSIDSSELTLQGSGTKNTDKLAPSSLPRMLVINSEPFTLWKEHFERLRGVVEAWEPDGRRVLTLIQAKHVSFSDLPLLPIIRKAKAEVVMDLISKLSLAFLDGETDDALRDVRTRKMETEITGKKPDGKPKRRCIGEIGDVIVH